MDTHLQFRWVCEWQNAPRQTLDYRLGSLFFRFLKAPQLTKPLIVRLRNWVGDVVLGIPLLRLLQANGYALELIGKPWAQELLRGEGWGVQTVASAGWPRVRQLRALRARCQHQYPRFDEQRLNALILPFSFSSALEMRCAGLRAAGVAHEARSVLLTHSLPRTRGLHELQAYWQLAKPFLAPEQCPLQPPPEIALQVAQQHQRTAQALCIAHQLQPGFVMLCPFAGGTFDKEPKTWPGFSEFSRALHRQGRTQVLCPGPGEEAQARQSCPHGVILSGVNLGVYAALLQRSQLMVSNDTGPGHLAAAVGTPTLSVLGPTQAQQWRPWGQKVVCIQGQNHQWPDLDQVVQQAQILWAGSEPLSHA
jgi:heptosyltransferase II